MPSRDARTTTPKACPPLAALEEYAAAGRPDLQPHIDACPKCASKAAALAEEVALIAAGLQAVEAPGPAECPPPEALACYLDNALPKENRKKIEQHLALCRLCQHKLKTIYRETLAAQQDFENEAPQDEPVKLKKRPKNKPNGPSVHEQEPAYKSPDGEQRKKRLSSDRG